MSFPQSTSELNLYAADALRLNDSMVSDASGHPRNDPAPRKNITETAGAVTFEDLLVAVGKTSNRDAFVRLFGHFAPRVKSFLMKGGLSDALADELAQETMLSVWDRAASYDPAKAAASTWIFTIARNKKIDYLRRSVRPETDGTDPALVADPSPNMPDDVVARAEEARALSEAMATLPAEQAEMIRQSFFEEMSHGDIAAKNKLPLGTVKSRIRLALEHLRKALGDKPALPILDKDRGRLS